MDNNLKNPKFSARYSTGCLLSFNKCKARQRRFLEARLFATEPVSQAQKACANKCPGSVCFKI